MTRITVNELIEEAEKHEITIYNICHRNAGWAVQWYEPIRDEFDNYKDGLIIYSYHRTFDKMVEAELKRLRDKS